MGGIGGLLQFLLGPLTALTDNLVTAGLAIFALTLGFFAIHYLGRRRQLLHQERMATLIKGLHYAGVARDVFAKPRPDPRDHLLRGLRWLFGGAGLSGALYGYERLQPTADPGQALTGALAGLVPVLIGLAHLLFSWICNRQSMGGMTAGGRGLYRTVGRRV